MKRTHERPSNQLRPVRITRRFTKHAAGSVLMETGDTRVLCTASIDDRVPFHLRGKNQGWVTGEYSMLPGSTIERSSREAARGRQGGRTQEIQRLIGRSLRSCIDLEMLGERSIIVDCDVLQADGGTRCASITGGFIALADAVQTLLEHRKIFENPIRNHVAAVSVGMINDELCLDLNYAEDSNAQTDMNFVMNENACFIEIQGTAEKDDFSLHQLIAMSELAKSGISTLIDAQKQALQQ
ncbi:MAG: ribonuclease PH [Acidiferrobacterales bacterium]|nr:ribonuclease PH [Acidiferrobacterales bacterium]